MNQHNHELKLSIRHPLGHNGQATSVRNMSAQDGILVTQQSLPLGLSAAVFSRLCLELSTRILWLSGLISMMHIHCAALAPKCWLAASSTVQAFTKQQLSHELSDLNPQGRVFMARLLPEGRKRDQGRQASIDRSGGPGFQGCRSATQMCVRLS